MSGRDIIIQPSNPVVMLRRHENIQKIEQIPDQLKVKQKENKEQIESKVDNMFLFEARHCNFNHIQSDPPPYTQSQNVSPFLSPVSPSAPLLCQFDISSQDNSADKDHKSIATAYQHDFFRNTIPLKHYTKILGVSLAAMICATIVLLLLLGKL